MVVNLVYHRPHGVHLCGDTEKAKLSVGFQSFYDIGSTAILSVQTETLSVELCLSSAELDSIVEKLLEIRHSVKT